MIPSRTKGRSGKPIERVPQASASGLTEVEARFNAAAARLHRAQEESLRATMEYIAAREALQAAQRAAAQQHLEGDEETESTRESSVYAEGAAPWS